jgi:hypothetical protein
VAPDPLKRAGFKDADDVRLQNARHLAKIAGQKPPKKLDEDKPFGLADAKAFAADAKRLLAHVEVMPPVEVPERKRKGRVQNGRTRSATPEQFAEVQDAVDAWGCDRLAKAGSIPTQSIYKAVWRKSCGVGLYSRVVAAAKALASNESPH